MAFLSCACANAVIPANAPRLPDDPAALKQRLRDLVNFDIDNREFVEVMVKHFSQNNIGAWNPENATIAHVNAAPNNLTSNILYYGGHQWGGDDLNIIYGVYDDGIEHEDEEGMDLNGIHTHWASALWRHQPGKLFAVYVQIANKNAKPSDKDKERVDPIGGNGAEEKTDLKHPIGNDFIWQQEVGGSAA